MEINRETEKEILATKNVEITLKFQFNILKNPSSPKIQKRLSNVNFTEIITNELNRSLSSWIDDSTILEDIEEFWGEDQYQWDELKDALGVKITINGEK